MEPKEHGENHHMPSTFRCRAALPDLTGVAGADFWGVLGSPARPTHLGFLLDGIVGFSQRCDG
jgi:hypothetical protein